MKAFDEVDFNELKKVCKAANDCGLMKPKLKYSGKNVNGAVVYNEFVMALENLDPKEQKQLPKLVVDFYNDIFLDEFPEEEAKEAGLLPLEDVEPEEEIIVEEAIIPPEDEDELNGLKELDFDEGIPDQEPLDDPEEEEVLDELDPDSVVVTEEADEFIPEDTFTPEDTVTVSKTVEEDLEEKEFTKMRKLAKIIMNVKIEDAKLTVTFKELQVNETFALPAQGDKLGLKAVRKKVFAFAKEKGATVGQCQAISKELNQAGYYMR
jgi:hypothetical protein